MTVKVVELNDSAVRLADENGILAQSPGFALVDGKTIHLGDVAEQQARLKPTSSFNKYWHELSMEPLPHDGPFRHSADIAHAHLNHLADSSGASGDVIFAVPGNFNQQQLAILLGIARQTPLNPVGVVDSGLAAALAVADAEHVIYVDMQLHQVVLTCLAVQDGLARTESVVQVPGVGTQSFMDLMMQLTTGLFIKQSRFNPQHNAESEQQLYNALPSWLQQEANEQGSLVLELNSGGTAYSAKLPRQSLVSSLAPHYEKLEKQIAALGEGRATQILLNEKMAGMPGFRQALSHYTDLVVLEPHALHRSCLTYHELIAGSDQGIRRVTSLPLDEARNQALSTRSGSREQPTHLLFANRAYPAAGLRLVNSTESQANGSGKALLNLGVAGLPEQLGRIESSQGRLILRDADASLRVNGEAAQREQTLALGDLIATADGAVQLNLIRVDAV
ncbi:MAG: hypothetical protein ACE37N_02205 [Pseudohongiellaceae bacterium]